MEALSSLRLDRSNNSYCTKNVHDNYIMNAVPQNPSRNMDYVDGRCLHLLSPNILLNVLPRQISNSKVLEQYINKNPQLKQMLDRYGLNIKNGDFNNFLQYTDEHMKQTAYIAGKICDEMGIFANKPQIVKAARLHDMGKIFIPAEILNKPENLTPEEKEIMNIHSELGHQLLTSLKIDPKTLDLIKNHHNFDGNSSVEQQIVSAADVYAALTEKRPYKESLSHEKAMQIMRANDFSDEVLDAVEKIAA